MTKDDLIRFEKEVADKFERKEIPGPIHLSGGNEDQLIEIFKDIKPNDWVFSTWRSHLHCLLHGVPEDLVMYEIMQGHSMNLEFPTYHFFTSAIVGGILPIAVGVAYALRDTGRKVWCFIGDMASQTGIFHESVGYSAYRNLPITFMVEDNGLSCNTPTKEATGFQPHHSPFVSSYEYVRQYPHCGVGKWVNF